MNHAVIFDMDGLMIDSERLYIQVETEIAADFGKELTAETLARMMGRKPIESMRIFADYLGVPERAEELLEKRDSMMLDSMKSDLQTMPGLLESIGLLRSEFKLAVATGAPEKFLNFVIDTLGLRDSYSFLQSSDTIKNGKPDPEIYLKTASGLQVSPDNCFVFEDSSNGCLSAHRAGMYCIAVPSEHTMNQDFSFVNHVADSLIDGTNHILNLLTRK